MLRFFPLFFIFFLKLWLQLRPESIQDVGSGFREENNGSNNSRWDLSENSANCTRYSLLLVFLTCNANYGVCRVAQALHTKKSSVLECGLLTFFGSNSMYNFLSVLALKYLSNDVVCVCHALSNIARLSVPFPPFRRGLSPLLLHAWTWRYHVIREFCCSLNSLNQLVRQFQGGHG